jgi:hypothetical protein
MWRRQQLNNPQTIKSISCSFNELFGLGSLSMHAQ